MTLLNRVTVFEGVSDSDGYMCSEVLNLRSSLVPGTASKTEGDSHEVGEINIVTALSLGIGKTGSSSDKGEIAVSISL